MQIKYFLIPKLYMTSFQLLTIFHVIFDNVVVEKSRITSHRVDSTWLFLI